MNVKFLVILSVAFMILSSCMFKEPTMPAWTTQLHLPLMNEIYYARDLADSNEIFIDQDSLLYFMKYGTLNSSSLEDNDLSINANSEGTGQIPIIEAFQSDSLQINSPESNNNVEISYGEINSGILHVNFSDTQTDLLKSVTLVFTELHDSSNQILSKTFSGIELQQNNIIDISSLTIYSQDRSQLIRNLHFNLQFESFVENTEHQILSYIHISYPNPIMFSFIEGLIHEKEFSIESFSDEIDIEYPDNIDDALSINQAQLKLNIWNKIGFKAKFSGEIKTSNSITGISKTLLLEDYIINAPEINGDSVLTEIILVENVNDLLNIAPDRIELINGRFSIYNPDDEIGFASLTSDCKGTYEMKVPFNITLNEGVPLRPYSLSEINLSESNRNDLKKRANYVNLIVKINNQFTVSASANLFICNSDQKETVYQTENINTAPLSRIVFLNNEVSSNRKDSDYTEFSFALNAEEIDIISRYEKMYVGLEFLFAESNTSVYSYQHVKVIAQIKAVVVIDEE